MFNLRVRLLPKVLHITFYKMKPSTYHSYIFSHLDILGLWSSLFKKKVKKVKKKIKVPGVANVKPV